MKNEPIRDEFLEKRKARQRKARKKRITISFIILIIALLITAVTLCLTVFFPIANITASGSKIYTSDEIIVNSGIKVGDNLFTFGQGRATDLLKNKLPFIENVEFSRELPNTLKIKVTDAKAYYCYMQDGVYYNVSKAGWVLEKVTEKDEDVFEIKALAVKCTVGNKIIFSYSETEERLNNIIGLLADNNLKIDYVDITDAITLKAGVEGRFDVNLGTENSLENKVKHLKVTVKTIPENESGSIDLSSWSDQNLKSYYKKYNTK